MRSSLTTRFTAMILWLLVSSASADETVKTIFQTETASVHGQLKLWNASLASVSSKPAILAESGPKTVGIKSFPTEFQSWRVIPNTDLHGGIVTNIDGFRCQIQARRLSTTANSDVANQLQEEKTNPPVVLVDWVTETKSGVTLRAMTFAKLKGDTATTIRLYENRGEQCDCYQLDILENGSRRVTPKDLVDVLGRVYPIFESLIRK